MSALTSFVAEALGALADADKARRMAGYMKTDMPFYGVMQPDRAPVSRELIRRFPVGSAAEYQAGVLALWGQPHREEKYMALAYAKAFPDFMGRASLALYERLIREGSWWDLVDDVAVHLVGAVLLDDAAAWEVVDPWIGDADLWMRRTAIICQNGHKTRTDEARLFEFCLLRAHEQEFFIRKAIGWALREYSYVAPASVLEFLEGRGSRLSGLSLREASRALVRAGYSI